MSYTDRWFGSAMDYTKAFEKAFEYTPPYQAAESTATVLVYADALIRAGALDTEKVRDALAGTALNTFYGRVVFDETGKNVGKPMVLRQIQGGKYVPVAPTKFVTGEVVHPRPAW